MIPQSKDIDQAVGFLENKDPAAYFKKLFEHPL